MNISIIGFGNMAKAMAKNLLGNKSIQLRVAAPSLSIGVNTDGIETHSDNLAIIPDADVIILAVKPVIMRQVLEQIRPALPTDCLIISVASGLKLEWFDLSRPIVRAMPNIAASMGQSATPLIANEFVTDTQKKLAEQLFSAMGITTWVTEESQMDAFTALSGSGPAYAFLFIEAMVNSAVALGLSKDIATSFALQTLQGALSLATSCDRSVVELREAVTSPAGTTAAAINVFMDGGFNELIHDAMQAAFERAKQLGQHF